MEKHYDLGVYIGRFQPPHNGHINTIRSALEMCNAVVVLIGSSNARRSPKNPFTKAERSAMIRNSLSDNEKNRYLITASLNDYLYEEDAWTTQVQDKVDAIAKKFFSEKDKVSIALFGHKKDDSSYYLNNFPNWDFIETGMNEDVLHATDIRRLMFEDRLHYTKSVISKATYDFITEWKKHGPFPFMKDEYEYYKTYNPAEYPVNMVTADSVVTQSGHILLIERKNHPGVGTLALPGGFVNQNEKTLDAAIRELREETRLKVPEKVLRGSIFQSEVIDNPSRSERGRIITHVYGFHLNDEEPLPRVRGDSDSRKAFWLPFSTALARADEFFEDHFHIISKFI